MDLDGLPTIGSGVDYTQVGAIHQKRTLAFINYFVTNTVSFLNNFSRSCEVRLQKCEARIQKLEASLGILEAKLSSIPGLDAVAHPVVQSDSSVCTSNLPALPDTVEEMPEIASTEMETSSALPPDIPTGKIPANQDPVFKRFFRMLQVGVPEPAVRQKMQAEGLDPNVLSNPEQLISESCAEPSQADTSSSQQSSGSFSD